MWYWLAKFVFLGPILHVLGRPTIEGLENVPDDGRAIMASNHQAVTDSFFLPLMVPRRITFLAKSEYFTGTGIKGALKRWFFNALGQVPIDRTSADAAQDALDSGLRILGKGDLLGIYPEGTRSPDGRLYKGKTGIARLALESGAVVVPVAMFGTDKVNPIGSRIWKPAKVTIKIGAPLDFSRYDGMAGNRFVERAVADEVMYELMKLTDKQYVDVYAASMKAAPPCGPKSAGSKSAGPTSADVTPAPASSRIPDTKAG